MLYGAVHGGDGALFTISTSVNDKPSPERRCLNQNKLSENIKFGCQLPPARDTLSRFRYPAFTVGLLLVADG